MHTGSLNLQEWTLTDDEKTGTDYALSTAAISAPPSTHERTDERTTRKHTSTGAIYKTSGGIMI